MKQPSIENTQNQPHAKNGPRRILLPCSTPFPNFILDHVMPFCHPAHWKVLCFIWRKTIGWDKQRDFLSLSQIKIGAGVCRDVALAGARFWETMGLIRRTRRSGIRGTKEYEVVLDYNKADILNRFGPQAQVIERSIQDASASRVLPPTPVEKIDPQKALDEKSLSQEDQVDVRRLHPDAGLLANLSLQRQPIKIQVGRYIGGRSNSIRQDQLLSARRAKLEERLAGKIATDGYCVTVSSFLRSVGYPEWWPELVEAFAALRYPLVEKDPTLTTEFAAAVKDVLEENREKNLTPGVLCCKVLDYCVRAHKRGDGNYFWPPSFQDHRDRLRAEERPAKQSQAGS